MGTHGGRGRLGLGRPRHPRHDDRVRYPADRRQSGRRADRACARRRRAAVDAVPVRARVALERPRHAARPADLRRRGRGRTGDRGRNAAARGRRHGGRTRTGQRSRRRRLRLDRPGHSDPRGEDRRRNRRRGRDARHGGHRRRRLSERAGLDSSMDAWWNTAVDGTGPPRRSAHPDSGRNHARPGERRGLPRGGHRQRRAGLGHRHDGPGPDVVPLGSERACHHRPRREGRGAARRNAVLRGDRRPPPGPRRNNPAGLSQLLTPGRKAGKGDRPCHSNAATPRRSARPARMWRSRPHPPTSSPQRP
ncbi:hypothetical protein SCOCK_40260 [Actinacidiphila cocklensis]|uniref:Uncharacterized protein n=1 Tax=Actinacidiphila cocklensis TaxID=887465 RepID=A0A9W4GU09_9ACTN|nr:hypothetical protein SCOCK_40260 [Actinacidiphila cocklensis]